MTVLGAGVKGSNPYRDIRELAVFWAANPVLQKNISYAQANTMSFYRPAQTVLVTMEPINLSTSIRCIEDWK